MDDAQHLSPGARQPREVLADLRQTPARTAQSSAWRSLRSRPLAVIAIAPTPPHAERGVHGFRRSAARVVRVDDRYANASTCRRRVETAGFQRSLSGV